ncbi:dipicolinate synthase subunit B [Bacillus velezensis]
MSQGAEVRLGRDVNRSIDRYPLWGGGDWVRKIEEATGFEAIDSIVKAEPLGPKLPLDCMVIAPLTGNSMSKLANAMTDSPVLMAAKATIRNGRPVVLGISTNDGLGLNGTNLMRLMSAKTYISSHSARMTT